MGTGFDSKKILEKTCDEESFFMHASAQIVELTGGAA
jgi:hypothetical protein